MTWNGSDPEAPYVLSGALHSFCPPQGYPAVSGHPFHLYVAFIGEGEEQDVWFDLVRLIHDEDGDVVDELEETAFGPFTLNLLPNRFVQGRWYVLRHVTLPVPGLCEFRLRLGGVEEPLLSERIQLEE